MRVLAVDQSYTSCGIVVLRKNEMVYAEKFVSDKEKDIFDRAWDVAQHIRIIADQFKVDLVALEGLAFGGKGNATRDLAGLQFSIVNILRNVGKYDVVIFSPGQVKKTATGKGRADKTELFESLPLKIKNYFVENMGLKKTTGRYDLSDAYWIGQTAIKSLEKKNDE